VKGPDEGEATTSVAVKVFLYSFIFSGYSYSVCDIFVSICDYQRGIDGSSAESIGQC